MSNDLRPRKLILEPGQLVIQTPRQLIEVPIERRHSADPHR